MRKPSAFVFSCLIFFALLTAAHAAIPNPTVIGPIPATAKPGDPSHNYIFIATNLDIASRGYVEEEFFLGGTANQYTIPTNWDTTTRPRPPGPLPPRGTRIRFA